MNDSSWNCFGSKISIDLFMWLWKLVNFKWRTFCNPVDGSNEANSVRNLSNVLRVPLPSLFRTKSDKWVSKAESCVASYQCLFSARFFCTCKKSPVCSISRLAIWKITGRGKHAQFESSGFSSTFFSRRSNGFFLFGAGSSSPSVNVSSFSSSDGHSSACASDSPLRGFTQLD